MHCYLHDIPCDVNSTNALSLLSYITHITYTTYILYNKIYIVHVLWFILSLLQESLLSLLLFCKSISLDLMITFCVLFSSSRCSSSWFLAKIKTFLYQDVIPTIYYAIFAFSYFLWSKKPTSLLFLMEFFFLPPFLISILSILTLDLGLEVLCNHSPCYHI